MSRKSTFKKLEENSEDVYKEVYDILLKVLDNVIKAPTNMKYRKLRLANELVSNKLMPAIGALECLFDFGFLEADEFLMLPETIPIEEIKERRHEFKQCHDEYLTRSRHKTATITSVHTEFFENIRSISKQVLLYENRDLQAAAKKLIPIEDLKSRCPKEVNKDDFVEEFAIIYQLMRWFKFEFFKWMDTPTCEKCNTSSTFRGYSHRVEDLAKASRVEEFTCQKCNDRLIFPRFNDPSMLLITRTGRCGEWANCFALLCRTLGYETRFILDSTDHVWVELFSKTLSRWIHCDPCENAIDTPLIYEKGWNKELSYVIGISCEEIQDVTWRYTTEFEKVRARRKRCDEADLILFMLDLSNELQLSSSSERKKYLTKRRLLECFDMLTPAANDTAEYSGRTSGSLQWRLSRNECSKSFKQFIWEPTPIEVGRKTFGLKYFSSKDIYLRTESLDVIDGWEKGVFEFESVFRKVEPDWKMCYLCRTEGSDTGSIKWKMSSKNVNLPIEYVSINYQCATFHSGAVRWLLCNDETCVALRADDNFLKTDAFRGSYDLSVTATLSGGNGKDSWQHAQLFRQSLTSTEFGFEIIIKFQV